MMTAEETLRLARQRWPKLFSQLDAMRAAEEITRRAADERYYDEQYAVACVAREREGKSPISRSLWLSGCYDDD